MHVSQLKSLCERAIQQRIFPGAAFAVGDTEHVETCCVGCSAYKADHGIPISEQSLFDLASLTKPLATARLAKLAVESGWLSLDSPCPFSQQVSLRDLLLHISGLPPYLDFHLQQPIPKDAVNLILVTKPDLRQKGSQVYSCLGFVWLQHWLEALFGRRIDAAFQERIAAGMGLRSTGYLPILWAQDADLIVPTQEIEAWRKPTLPEEQSWRGYVRGAVHDPIAYLQGGVSGNAGLFSSIVDVAQMAQADLRKALDDGPNDPWTCDQGMGRALGWMSWTAGCSAGVHFSQRSFGHTGYTGTSTWIDPLANCFAVLLTNRVHPDDRVNLLDFRRAFHGTLVRG